MNTEDVIARRVLDKDGQHYEVLIYRPTEDEISDYSCRWSLVDEAGMIEATGKMHGIDEVQVLLFTLMILGDQLAAMPGDYSHLGTPDGGFPRMVHPGNDNEILWRLPLGT